MKTQLSRIALALGVTTVLGACASLSDLHITPPGEGSLAQIHYGQTQDEVRAIAGNPVVVRTEPRQDETVWIYSFTDDWSYPSEFDVSFDRTGKVSDISAERTHD